MPVEQIFEHFFKPETKRSGADYFSKNSVILSNKSDTHIQGYIKGGTSARVALSSISIESDTISANCSCPVSTKGQFCKHIWAVLLTTEKDSPDFLSSKINIEKISKVNPKQDAYKEKQSDYRKLQYQKQKLSAKKIKLQKDKQKLQENEPKFPDYIESALTFFSENGFPIEKPLQEDVLNSARKRLARVFHPDMGGSHEEIVILNENYNVLIQFLNS